MSAGYRRVADGEVRADWSRAALGDPALCVLGCGTHAILRHPQTGRPCHKTCDDQRAAAELADTERRLTGRAATNRTLSLSGA